VTIMERAFTLLVLYDLWCEIKMVTMMIVWFVELYRLLLPRLLFVKRWSLHLIHCVSKHDEFTGFG
jgi:hypothetical protein